MKSYFSPIPETSLFPSSLLLAVPLLPQPGIETAPLAVRAQSPNHWTASEFPPHFSP